MRNLDRDPGDLDQLAPGATIWHQSFLPATPPDFSDIHPTAAGRAALKDCLAGMRKPPAPPRRIPKDAACWARTPEAFRKLICRAAGLDISVISKLDRDLTEQEKAAIRGAAQRLRDRADALFAI